LLVNQFGYLASGRWVERRASNFTDGGAPWYNVYETAEGGFVSVAAVEPKFYAELLAAMEIDPTTVPDQFDRASWPALRDRFAAVFKSRTRDAWTEIMEGRSACFAPVLGLAETIGHPQYRARAGFVEVDGVVQPAPAPRFSRTPGVVSRPPAEPGEHTGEVLSAIGFDPAELARLRDLGAIA
jgi:alpha-methylacyl-CoA racemase